MLMQLGFERAFFNASLEVIGLLDGDIFLQRASKYRFATRDPFPGRDLEAHRHAVDPPHAGHVPHRVGRARSPHRWSCR